MFRTDLAGRRERIAGELRAHMARQRITATVLSEAVGIPQATLSRKLNGKSGFTLDELFAIGDQLGVDVTEVLAAAA
jgi:DNA-binding Xre family transcriptional regulator